MINLMEYKEMVQKIIDLKSPDWDKCHEALLNKYKEYYHNDISLDKELLSRPTSLMYNYTFKLKLEAVKEFTKNLLNHNGVLLNELYSYNIADIYINFKLDKNNKNICKIRASQVSSSRSSWWNRSSSDPESKYWFLYNKILIRKLNTYHWYRYSWLLDIDLTSPYKNLNKYKMLDHEIHYYILTGSELSNTLKAMRPYWGQTILYELLLSQDLILMRCNNIQDHHKDLYVAIPDSEIRWHDYELMWVFNFYL